jgi:anti-sigma factor RsiW
MDRSMKDDVSTDLLIEYHFGTLDPEARSRVEEQLLASADALRSYLQLKRQLDGASGGEVPSPDARARLRAAVAAAHGPGPARSVRRILRRPMPLYQALAVAAAAALTVGALRGWQQPSLGDSPGGSASSMVAPIAGEPSPPVDSARTVPFSLQIF